VPRGITLQLLTGPLRYHPAPRAVIESLQEAQVTENAGQRSGFQLRFALGKSSELEQMLVGRKLDPPARVLIVLHIDGTPHVLSDGVITRHDIAQSNEAGQSTLTITGVDISQMLDLIDLSGLPLPMPIEAQVLLMLAPLAIYGTVPAVVPSALVWVPNPIKLIPCVQGTAYSHITGLADDVGYTFFVEPGNRPGLNVAYWGPEYRISMPQPALTVNSDIHSNVESLSFSFDGISRTVFVLTYYPSETAKIPIPIPLPDLTPLSPPLGRKIPIPLSYKRMNIVRRTESDGSDDSTARMEAVEVVARGLARASQAANVISGSGSLDVMRYGRLLRSRRLVGVRGAGQAYDGEYVVRSVTTTIKAGEVKQRFTLARNMQVSLFGKVLR
jgi:hypothetical protein